MSKTHAKLNNSTPEHRINKNNQKNQAFNADLKEWVTQLGKTDKNILIKLNLEK